MSSGEPPQSADHVPAPPPVRIRRARPRWPLLVATIGLAAIAAVVVFLLRQPVQFSADFVMSWSASYGGAPIRTEMTTGTYYARGRHMRRVESTSGSSRTITIQQGDKLWHLDPATKTYYLVFDFTPEQKARFDVASRRLDELSKNKDLRKRGLVGTEVVNGYLCEKRAVDAYAPNMTGWGWFSPRLNLIVKSETTMRSEVSGVALTTTSRREYRNIKEHRLPSSLFEVPKDYREVPHPGPKHSQSGQSAER